MVNKIKVDTDEIRKLRSCLKTNIGSIIKTHNKNKQSIHTKMQKVINEYGSCSEICSEARAIISLLEEADRAVRRMTPRYEDIISGLEYTVSSTKQCERDIKRIIGIESIEQPHVRDRNTRKVSTRKIEADSDLIEEEIEDEGVEEDWGMEENLTGLMGGISLMDLSFQLEGNRPNNDLILAKGTSEIEAKRLIKVEKYTSLLNQSIADGQGEPQWLLDALAALGVSYSMLGKEKLLQQDFTETIVEKMTNLFQDTLKKYNELRTEELRGLKERLKSGNLPQLTESDITFYEQMPTMLSELGISLSTKDQANLLSCLRIKGEVERIDLKRFGLTPESGISEKELEELSRTITLKYDAEYYNKKNTEAFNQKLDLFNSFITDVNMNAVALGEATVDLGVDMAVGAYKIGVEPVGRLGDLFAAWNLKNLGGISQEAFDKKFNDYCNYADNLTSGLGSALINVGNTNLEENTILSPLYYTATGFNEYMQGNMTHEEKITYFKKVIESVMIVEGGIKGVQKGSTIVKSKLEASTVKAGAVEGLNQVDELIKSSDDLRYEKYWDDLAKRTNDMPSNWTPEEYQKYLNATEKVEAELALKKIDGDELIKSRNTVVKERVSKAREIAIEKGTPKTWEEFLVINSGKSVEEASVYYIELIEKQSPWPENFVPQQKILKSGDTFQMALDSMQPVTSPGNFATFDDIPNVGYVRDNLAVKSDWKVDCSKVVTYRVKQGVELPVLEGPVGPQIDINADKYLPGGGTQIQMLLDRNVNKMDYLEIVSIRSIN